MLEFEISSARVEVQKTLAAPQLTIYADRTLIRQVLVNLCKNACEALRENPPVDRKLTIGVASSPASIGLFVADNGPGIADDVRDSLFERFTTTKPNHSGVGLTICKMIGELHGGRIEVHSDPERGATFTLVLPLCSP
jgi:signal transduction histidine kinase